MKSFLNKDENDGRAGGRAYGATSRQRRAGVVCEGYVCLRTARRRHVSLIRRLIHLACSWSTRRRRKPQPTGLCTPLGVQSTDSAPGGPPQVCIRGAKPETRPHPDEPLNLSHE